jgi:hypothetical protein
MEVRILSALEGLLHAKADRQGHGPFRITRGPASPASAGRGSEPGSLRIFRT